MGSHAAPNRRKRALLLPLGLMLLAVLLGVPRADGAPASADACRTTGTELPRGDCGPF